MSQFQILGEHMLHVDGACHCERIKFEAEVDSSKVVVCHCTDCQVIAGAPFRVVVPASKEHFKLLQGQPKTYLKTADSGNRRIQAFCPDCGSSIYATSEFDQAVFGLRVGSLKQKAQLIPTKQIWCRSSMPWLHEIESLPKVEKQS
jgi:hypothetical protein